ncbi:MAG: hypothetical protein HY403_08755 [Elusimicrobia bacterium]|nr:hypothetical protein [Elusimicrobiota bacterium]
MVALSVAAALLFAAAPPRARAAAPRTITAELGREFTLRKGQRARIKDADASILLTGFINSPCPKGMRCIWSGQKVELELTVSGATVPLDATAPYSAAVVRSDYRTRAALVVSPRGESR